MNLQKKILKTRHFRSFTLVLLFFLSVVACSARGGSNAPTTECRMVQHSMGETCVPLNPQRIVVLGGLDSAIALGVKPLGTTDRIEPFLTPYLNNEATQSVVNIGLYDTEPNLEAILKLKPDLILGISWEIEIGTYPLISQIAPTVVVAVEAEKQWREPLKKYAEALGKTAEAEKILANYNARLAEFKEKMGDQTTVSFIRVYSDGVPSFYLKSSFGGSILEDAGLKRPPAQDIEPKGANQQRIDKEVISILDADVMFVWTYGHTSAIAQEAQTALKRIKTDPFWLSLNAVQQNRVYEVPASYWAGFGPLAANLVVDDLFKYFLGEK
ncbi:iron-siderophore ABC transporter substrate-binding protein [Gloeocapsopsis sp. IPPAS B-1203]|uniref:ABC transporter substrate-binding protein n=1 Tax=Gloeocapsopsis sp. IPPAS B-1203 TaxID=2049454 RepID=UPI000C18159F|nr:iron-siderophore ABC transporter substrate-binding protein [Gloeocapsopsis sp. IPPAS B-1203]PIG94575.1 ABC transporter substrate-binding protein [Gloeocapsopsis sp. IPPAS B-1203]